MGIDKKRILLVCNESNSTINFRKELILFLQRNNFDVFVTSRDNERQQDIENLGCKFFEAKFKNRSKSIIGLRKFKKQLLSVIDSVKPDIVFSFMLKPNIAAPIVSKKRGIKDVFAMVEGLGDPFQPRNVFQKFVRFAVCHFMRKSFKCCKKGFVLNNDDKKELLERKIVQNNKIVIIPGIGIDTKQFSPNYLIPKTKRVVMFARLIRSKGIFDFCEVAKFVKQERSDISFELYGQEDEITIKDLKPYIDKGYISYNGYTKDAKNIMLTSSIVVSTSKYREGMPRVILEAMALGKLVIASNTVGSKDLVINGETGFLFEMNNPKECSKIILDYIDDDKKLLELGKNARKICESKYDSELVNDMIFKIITE